jgi:hypothetical protein
VANDNATPAVSPQPEPVAVATPAVVDPTPAVVVPDTPKVTDPEVPTVPTPVTPEVPAVVEPTPVVTPEPVVVPTPTDSKVVPATVSVPVNDAPQPNDLSDKNTELVEENKSLVQKIADLQTKLRSERIAQLLDLKQALGLETCTSEEERKAVVDELQKRSLESIEDAIADLRKATKAPKRIKPALVSVKDDEHGTTPVQSELDRLQRTIDNLTPLQIGALLFSGKFMPRVDK